MTDMQPGQLIVPHDEGKPADGAPAQPTVSQPVAPVPTPPAPLPPAPIALPQTPASTPVPQQTPVEQPTAAAATPAAETEQASSFYRPHGDQPASAGPTSPQSQAEDVMWTAAEFVDNHKGTSWYLSLSGIGAVAVAIAYFLIEDLFSAIIIALAFVVFAVYASHKPREQQYHLNTFGVQVGTKVYEFHDFKAFSITHDEDVISVALRPLKRFMPAPTLYVIPEVEDRVVELLSMVMPAEQRRPDAIDSLMRKIRF